VVPYLQWRHRAWLVRVVLPVLLHPTYISAVAGLYMTCIPAQGSLHAQRRPCTLGLCLPNMLIAPAVFHRAYTMLASSTKQEVNNVIKTPSEKDRNTSATSSSQKFVKVGHAVPKIWETYTLTKIFHTPNGELQLKTQANRFMKDKCRVFVIDPALSDTRPSSDGVAIGYVMKKFIRHAGSIQSLQWQSMSVQRQIGT